MNQNSRSILAVFAFSMLSGTIFVGNVSACTQAKVFAALIESVAICPLNGHESFPTVLVALIVRNKAHILPYFLAFFEKQTYPKTRMLLWIRTDHNFDKSGEILKLWVNHTAAQYHSVDLLVDDRVKRYRDEFGPNDWSVERIQHYAHLKESALNRARELAMDYAFFLEPDVLLTEEETIALLVSLRVSIVSPMLECTDPSFMHFKTRTPKFFKNTNTLMEVELVSQAVLIKLNYPGAQMLTFEEKSLLKLGKNCSKPRHGSPDYLIFSASAECAQVPMLVYYRDNWGYFMYVQILLPWEHTLLDVINIKTKIVLDLDIVAPVHQYLQHYVYSPKKSKMFFDEIYMINLDRRPYRRAKMEKLFEVLGLEVTRFPAIDSRSINNLREYNVTLMPEFRDPYKKRGMTLGEVGCFLSHYYIWKRMVAEKQQIILILEDDVLFGPFFQSRLTDLFWNAEARTNFDLLYLERRKVFKELEPWYRPKDGVKYVDFSYRSLGYILTLQGAKKLLAAKPLEKLIPVDEFFPIMYGAGRNKTWMSYFPIRNLIALAPRYDLIGPLIPLALKSDTEE